MATTIVFEQDTPSATTDTTVYTVTAAKKSIVDINLCNTGSSAIVIRLFVTLSATTSYFEKDLVLTAAGTVGAAMEYTRKVFPATAAVKVYTDVATLDVTISGVEEDI